MIFKNNIIKRKKSQAHKLLYLSFFNTYPPTAEEKNYLSLFMETFFRIEIYSIFSLREKGGSCMEKYLGAGWKMGTMEEVGRINCIRLKLTVSTLEHILETAQC
uniref:Uncharacterized protein n=1 Tax=Cacopsylla melanoneura TaxID=428564 RepID=A0A8D8TL79_9HEMI